MADKNNLMSEAAKRLRGNKKLIIPIALGCLAALLLLISEIIPDRDETRDGETLRENETAVAVSEYAADIESRLSALIARIEGAGAASVMVTLESGAEQVYAENEKLESDVKRGEEGSENTSRESEYLVVESGGDERGLTLKLIEPRIRGVAVVCEGADSAVVVQSITRTVTALLDVGSSRVSVVKMKK